MGHTCCAVSLSVPSAPGVYCQTNSSCRERSPYDDCNPLIQSGLQALDDWRIDPGRLQRSSHLPPLGQGGFGVVEQAILHPTTSGPAPPKDPIDVAVKCLRLRGQQFHRVALRLLKEAKIWSMLCHENILPFLGFHLDTERKEALLVSPHLKAGNMRAYLKRNPSVTLSQRVGWAQDLTNGLAYLHGFKPPIVHGDLKAENVLVDAHCKAVLCDLDLASVMHQAGDEDDEDESSGIPSAGFKGSVRWCSPEIINGEQRTLPSDIWSWAHLVLEILTGRLPYYRETNDTAVMLRIISNRPPSWHEYPDMEPLECLWTFLSRCWEYNGAERPVIVDCQLALTSSLHAFESAGPPSPKTARKLGRTTPPIPLRPSTKSSSYLGIGDTRIGLLHGRSQQSDRPKSGPTTGGQTVFSATVSLRHQPYPMLCSRWGSKFPAYELECHTVANSPKGVTLVCWRIPFNVLP